MPKTTDWLPTAQITVETYLAGRHELGVKIIYVTGNATDPANKGYRIWYTVVAQGETPPQHFLMYWHFYSIRFCTPCKIYTV